MSEQNRLHASVGHLHFELTEGSSSGWIGGYIPSNISELTEYLAAGLKDYRLFPQQSPNYYRPATVIEGSRISYTEKRKNPRMVGARMVVAHTLLRNVHWWLDEHRIPDRPLLETPSDDEEENDRRLSLLLIWLEKAAAAITAMPRLTVNLDKRTVTLDGAEHEVNSVNALRWVKVLADHPGKWISGPDLEKYDPDLTGARTERLAKYLPGCIFKLIKSEPAKGSRIRLA